MRREEVLEYEVRRRLYDLIRREPGLHLRELERRSGLTLGTLRHHLRFLTHHRLVDVVADENRRRYFVTAFAEEVDRATLSALRQEALRRVLLYVLAHGGSAAYRHLERDLGAPPSSLAVYLAQLAKRGLLVRTTSGRESRYALADAERTIRLLHTFRASFFDELVDHVLDLAYRDEPDA